MRLYSYDRWTLVRETRQPACEAREVESTSFHATVDLKFKHDRTQEKEAARGCGAFAERAALSASRQPMLRRARRQYC